MNKLYFGDNFEILCEMDAERVDLICTDPPFNSRRNYNAFFKDSKAQNKAFTETEDVTSIWWVMQPVMPSSKEWLGYPIQKPPTPYSTGRFRVR